MTNPTPTALVSAAAAAAAGELGVDAALIYTRSRQRDVGHRRQAGMVAARRLGVSTR